MATAVLIQEIVEAIDFASDEMSSFVNTASGQVRTVTHEELALAEEQEPDVPDWQRQAIDEAKEVIDSDEWVELPSKVDIHEWQIMDEFAQGLSDLPARADLRNSLRGQGAFRHFKATLRRLDLEDAWFQHKRKALEDIARSWLADHGLRPDESTKRPSESRPTSR